MWIKTSQFRLTRLTGGGPIRRTAIFSRLSRKARRVQKTFSRQITRFPVFLGGAKEEEFLASSVEVAEKHCSI